MAQAIATEALQAGPALYTDAALKKKVYDELLSLATQPLQHKAVVEAFKENGDVLLKFIF